MRGYDITSDVCFRDIRPSASGRSEPAGHDGAVTRWAETGHKRSVDHAVGIGDNHDELSIFRATMSNDQRNVCQRFGTEYMPPEASQKVGISLGSLEDVPLHAVRLSPDNGTCGWYIYGGEYSPDANFYQPLHVAHLIERCPNIVPYLALPPGWRVLLAPDYEDVWFDGELLKNVIDSL